MPTPPYPITINARSLEQAFASASSSAQDWARKNNYPDFFLSLESIGAEALQGKFRYGEQITFYFHVEPRAA